LDFDYEKIKQIIKEIMSEKCGIVRKSHELQDGIVRLNSILNDFKRCNIECQNGIESFNMALISNIILESTLKMKDSVGAHTLQN
jgi:aspartate oxidase